MAVSTRPSFKSIWIIWPPIIRTCDVEICDAVDAGQLRDHLELDRPVGQQLEGGERVGEDRPGRDPLELLDHVLGPLVALLGELILGLAAEQMGAEQQVAGAEASRPRA